MAPPVDTSVKHYRSDMPSAPVLNGTAGSKIAQLESCLVTGYGLKAVTSLVVAGGVATLAFTGGASAAWKDAVVLVAGVTGAMAGLNGEQKVTFADASTVKFASALADGTAAGTVTFKIAPAGWEKVYSKTNVAVFRSLGLSSSKMLLRVDDTNAQYVRVVAYESMTDVDTGSGPFPTPVERSAGGNWAKSDASNSNPVAWILVVDERFLYDVVAAGSNVGMAKQGCNLRGFGDPLPRNPAGDVYACLLNYSISASAETMHDNPLDAGNGTQIAMARGYTGLGGSVVAKRSSYFGSPTLASGRDGTCGAFPSPVDGSLILSKVYAGETIAPRCDLPGLYTVPQSAVWDSIRMFDVVEQDGKRYIASACGMGAASSNTSSSNNAGCSLLDISGPW